MGVRRIFSRGRQNGLDWQKWPIFSACLRREQKILRYFRRFRQNLRVADASALFPSPPFTPAPRFPPSLPSLPVFPFHFPSLCILVCPLLPVAVFPAFPSPFSPCFPFPVFPPCLVRFSFVSALWPTFWLVRTL